MRTKIITLLRAMTVRERSQWQKYMESDWCCTHPQQRALCALLLTYAPGFEHPDLNKPAVFTAIYGADAAYDDLKINNLLSDVYESALQYLAELAAADRPIQSALDAVRDLLRRDLDDLASRQLARVRTMLDQKPAQTTSWLQYEQQYWEAAEELYSHLGQRTDGLHLQRQSDAADRAMILEKLRFACAMLSRNSLAVMQTHYTPRWIDPVRDWCIQDAFLNTDPVVQVYLAALQLHQIRLIPTTMPCCWHWTRTTPCFRCRNWRLCTNTHSIIVSGASTRGTKVLTSAPCLCTSALASGCTFAGQPIVAMDV